MLTSWSVELEETDPPKQPPDKFKVPLPKPNSAFQPVIKPEFSGNWAGTLNKGLRGSNQFSTYEYILKKALRNPNDITTNEKMILRNHPVIAELIKQTNVQAEQPQFSYYIPIESIVNYQYCHSAQIPILYDSREKWSSFDEDQVVQYTSPLDEERLSDSTKGYSDYNLMLDEDDQKTIGKYTVRERRERIRKYKLKLRKYKLGLSKTSHKYKQRSVIAKTRPRVRGKFAKNSQSADMTEH